ncbi:hypothetical protein LEL_10936 [Akanthomyces lecanii RCEF 1005]|uniref:Uncharacterized protein n=1 Tax=Akanthomyces lecanii RCEF 1005 TaxID=1081108 RepID=A0A167PYL7_CORDF|nr:hypothetical protein LEL_10936 [Akanthomyces lecanii RCEF 1005]
MPTPDLAVTNEEKNKKRAQERPKAAALRAHTDCPIRTDSHVTDHLAHGWWASVKRTEYLKLGLGAELKKLPELSLPRRLLGYLLTARSQHGDFTEYYKRFHPGQATLECPYGR